MVLETTRLIREGILQQNATEAVDAYSSVEKQIRLLDWYFTSMNAAWPLSSAAPQFH